MKENDSLFYSLLLSMNDRTEHEETLEDMRYAASPLVSSCQLKMYKLVIMCLSRGMTYEEISKYITEIENINTKLTDVEIDYLKEYQRLNDEEKNYLQRKLRKDLRDRERNSKKLRRENYE